MKEREVGKKLGKMKEREVGLSFSRGEILKGGDVRVVNDGLGFELFSLSFILLFCFYFYFYFSLFWTR